MLAEDMTWEFDTPPHPQLNLYSRGWAREVMPRALTPMTATLFMPIYEKAWKRYFSESLPLLPELRTAQESTLFANIFSGRFYVNLSFMRIVGDALPNGAAAEMDAYFAPGATPPRYVRPLELGSISEVGERMRAFSASVVLNPPQKRLEGDFESAMTLRVDGQQSRALATDEAELIERVLGLAVEVEDACLLHIAISGIARGMFKFWDLAVAPELTRETQGLKYAALSNLQPVSTVFARSGGGDDEDLKSTFGEEMGFRSPNEWELGARSWDQRSEMVPRRSQVKQAPPEMDTVLYNLLARRGDLRDLLDRARMFIRLRELSKTNCLILTNEWRLDLARIGEMLSLRRVLANSRDIYMLSLEELQTISRSEGRPLSVGVLEGRKTMLRLLDKNREPLFIDLSVSGGGSDQARVHQPPSHEIQVVNDAIEGSRERSYGIGVSAGSAHGKVIIADDVPSEPVGPGHILVAKHTDPGWLPVLLEIDALVLETGTPISHGAIVARELGIPAVVGVGDCRIWLKDGDEVIVDGDAGVVTKCAHA